MDAPGAKIILFQDDLSLKISVPRSLLNLLKPKWSQNEENQFNYRLVYTQQGERRRKISDEGKNNSLLHRITTLIFKCETYAPTNTAAVRRRSVLKESNNSAVWRTKPNQPSHFHQQRVDKLFKQFVGFCVNEIFSAGLIFLIPSLSLLASSSSHSTAASENLSDRRRVSMESHSDLGTNSSLFNVPLKWKIVLKVIHRLVLLIY